MNDKEILHLLLKVDVLIQNLHNLSFCLSATMYLYIIVSYCSNERMFSDHMFSALQDICQTINEGLDYKFAHAIVSVGSHLYNGRVEDEEHISSLKIRYPMIDIVRYDVNLRKQSVELHNLARQVGVNRAIEIHGLCENHFWSLFLDGDELPESGQFSNWYISKTKMSNSNEIQGFDSRIMKLANYWYFMHPSLVSNVFEDSVLMVHSSRLSLLSLSHPRERDGIIIVAKELWGENDTRMIKSMSGRPMFHHYSWVRDSDVGLYTKVVNWGHSKDKPWMQFISDTVFNIQFHGIWPDVDFVHGYRLIHVQDDHLMFKFPDFRLSAMNTNGLT